MTSQYVGTTGGWGAGAFGGAQGGLSLLAVGTTATPTAAPTPLSAAATATTQAVSSAATSVASTATAVDPVLQAKIAQLEASFAKRTLQME